MRIVCNSCELGSAGIGVLDARLPLVLPCLGYQVAAFDSVVEGTDDPVRLLHDL